MALTDTEHDNDTTTNGDTMSTTTTASPLAAIATWEEDMLTEDQRADVLALAEQILRGEGGEGADLAVFDPGTHVTPAVLMKPRIVVSEVTVSHDPVEVLGGGEYVLTIRGVRYRDPVRHEAWEPLEPLARDTLRLGERLPDSLKYRASPGDEHLWCGSVDLTVGSVSVFGSSQASGGNPVTLPTGLRAESLKCRVRFDIA
ncbi:hypothetical protein I8D64_13980 [Brachybacterium sp. MASK1Z-5]|uniref:Uncharacterized protein n=1 Tax=Brachybacterium halotolerans TaxID=2795215 RepID=A0ABS1BCY7_9MICO|nr:hypothetical protein [Brachybacterium halotolerans]MBK0332505.1 hypothetical protein [Brachybacterium halotolerans]